MREFAGQICLTTLVLAASCTAPPPTVDPAAVETAVRDVVRQYGEHINTGNWAATLELYSDDERFHWVEDGAIPYPDKAAVRAARITAGDVRVTVLSADHALATFTYNQQMRLRSGSEFEFSGVITMVLQREQSGWNILSGHSSSPRG